MLGLLLFSFSLEREEEEEEAEEDAGRSSPLLDSGGIFSRCGGMSWQRNGMKFNRWFFDGQTGFVDWFGKKVALSFKRLVLLYDWGHDSFFCEKNITNPAFEKKGGKVKCFIFRI